MTFSDWEIATLLAGSLMAVALFGIFYGINVWLWERIG